MEINYWILKSEPSTYSIDDLQKDKSTRWDGVRNYQARNNLRKMKKGDKAIIYHSGDDKAAVGLAKIATGAYQDPTTKEDWSVVDISFESKLKAAVPLSEMKSDATLKSMDLVRQSRLSVSQLTKKQYDRILEIARKA